MSFSLFEFRLLVIIGGNNSEEYQLKIVDYDPAKGNKYGVTERQPTQALLDGQIFVFKTKHSNLTVSRC